MTADLGLILIPLHEHARAARVVLGTSCSVDADPHSVPRQLSQRKGNGSLVPIAVCSGQPDVAVSATPRQCRQSGCSAPHPRGPCAGRRPCAPTRPRHGGCAAAARVQHGTDECERRPNSSLSQGGKKGGKKDLEVAVRCREAKLRPCLVETAIRVIWVEGGAGCVENECVTSGVREKWGED